MDDDGFERQGRGSGKAWGGAGKSSQQPAAGHANAWAQKSTSIRVCGSKPVSLSWNLMCASTCSHANQGAYHQDVCAYKLASRDIRLPMANSPKEVASASVINGQCCVSDLSISPCNLANQVLSASTGV